MTKGILVDRFPDRLNPLPVIFDLLTTRNSYWRGNKLKVLCMMLKVTFNLEKKTLPEA